MFEMLPIEIEYMIYKIYFSKYVLNEIQWQESIWEQPSREICLLTRDVGRIQAKHTDLERLFDEFLPHSNCMESILDMKTLDWLVPCEDCRWEKFRCPSDKREEKLLNMLEL